MTTTTGPPALTLPADNDWLGWVNYWRATAGQPPVPGDAALAAADQLHAAYMLATSTPAETCAGYPHCETPSNPKYTTVGNNAAGRSNLMESGSERVSARSAIELWMSGPWHASGIVAPNLKRVGYGSATGAANKDGWRSVAALDVLSGQDYLHPPTQPWGWPGNGASIPMTRYFGGEFPDPLATCTAMTTTPGLAVWAMFPGVMQGGPLTTTFTDVTAGSAAIPVCVVPAGPQVVLIPKAALTVGHTYRYVITNTAKTFTSTFTTVPRP